MRKRDTDCDGKPFQKSKADEVWERGGTYSSGHGDSEIKIDDCNNKIRKGDHGDTDSDLGWEIDHIKPVSKGGSDDLSNLRPLYWETNRDKGDKYPCKCP